MWRVVSSSANTCLFFFRYKYACLVGRFLWSRPAPQLSALHGDYLPRLPYGGRFPEVPDFHRPHHASSGADRHLVTLLASRSALDLYHLSHRQPVALQRSKLRLIHDVCAPRWLPAEFQRATTAVYSISDFLCNLISELPHRTFS